MKPHYLFKEQVPLDILYSLLNKICPNNEPYYIVDNNVFSKMLYYDYHIVFLEKVLPYYYDSKKHFVTRNLTYNSFITILRQICNINNIHYISDKKYNRSEYSIRYMVPKNN